MTLKHKLLAATGAVALLAGTAANATIIEITVTNVTGNGGFSITPLYTAFHDGTFDAFNVGDPASAGIELIAETGSAATLRTEREAADPDSQFVTLASPSGPPPVQPGESVTAQLDVDGTNNQFLSFFAMLLPSNDAFIGNDDPDTYRIFNADGSFAGAQTITVGGSSIYDAGTEANALTGSAFVAGQDIGISGGGEGTIQAANSGNLTSIFAGATLATGDTLGNGGVLNFNSPQFDLLEISITEVTAVPLPASAPLLLGALGFMGWRARKAKR